MSTSGTVRRFGTAKTYGRTRENNSSASFDEISGKPVPIKASPAHTKWGKTNFVAIRKDKKSVFEPPPEPVKKDSKPEDPFSFDTEDKRKVGTRSQHGVTAEPQRLSTRLPASRIVTQGKKGPEVEPKDFVGPENNETAIARPGKTYSKSQEGRLSSVPASPLIMDQFVEVGKTVKTDSGYEVVYSIQPHKPSSTTEVPVTVKPALATMPEPAAVKPRTEKARTDPPITRPPVEPVTKKPSPASDDDDDDDIFPATFRRTPLKTYTGEIITPIIDIPDDPPPKKRKRGPTGYPRGRRASRYTDPHLIEEYRRRYEATHGKREPTAGMFNSTVVSSRELRNTEGTTLVVVCKPKVEVLEKKDDVQTKYFKNVKKELEKSDKNLEAAETVSQETPGTPSSSASETAASATPSPIIKKSSASSQDSGSSSSTPSRLLKVRFADEETCSAANTLTSLSASVVQKQSKGSVVTRSREKQSSQASQESVSSNSSKNSSSTNSSVSDKSDASIASRTRSGRRQYRIFKSRGPPQPAAKESAKQKDKDSTSADAQDNNTEPDSPPMPELTREVPDTQNDKDSSGQNPPNIFGEEESSIADETETETDQAEKSPQTSEAKEASDSQVSEQSTEDMSERTEESVEESSGSQVRASDSQDTPSPAASDDQEVSQEVASSVEGSQKENNVPALPRRFFKSKAKTPSTTPTSLQRKVFEKSPSKASYNVRSWQREEEGADKEDDTGLPPAKQAKRTLPFSEEAAAREGTSKASKEPRLTRAVHWPKDKNQQAYTSVRVQKQHKELYTVVHNVKMAYEVQESGETQDFMDDVEYLLENLKDSQPLSIRALSTIQLAGKCISPAFRMHLRAHGIVTKIFSLLHDACSSPSLALSTASMMFMLSRDRLNMDLDKESLHLMLKLNEVDMPRADDDNDGGATAQGSEGQEGEGGQEGENPDNSTEVEKGRARVQELLVQLQKETNAKQIDLDFVSTGNLAMESLLSLTSRRAGEWFKEELRMLGGLDHFVESVHRCGSGMKEDLAANLDRYTPSLRKLDRCLRVLENITLSNTDNQNHIIAYSKGLLITATARVLQQCVQCLPTMPLLEVCSEIELKEQAAWIVFDTLLAILKVLLNVTHDSEEGSKRAGQEEGLMHTVLTCVSITQWCVPPDQRFDLLVLSLGLLINLVEHSPDSRQYLVDCKLMTQTAEGQDPTETGAVETLVQLFLQRETAARQMEEAPETPSKPDDSINKSGEWRESDSGIEWIAKSAEKVKAAEEQRKETEKEAEKEAEKETEKGQDGETPAKGEKEGEDANKTILEDEETFTKALHKAGKHMENSIVASYVGLLLGCLIQENKEYVGIVKQYLPDGSFDSMIKILKKFLGFMNLTTAIGTTDANSIQRVIDTLEAC